MKKIFFLLIACISIPTFARIGCRDDSWHMQKRYDYKEDHAVECYCDCANTLGRCKECGHYHKPQPWTIIEEDTTTVDTTYNEQAMHSYDPMDVLQKVVAQHKNSKK